MNTNTSTTGRGTGRRASTRSPLRRIGLWLAPTLVVAAVMSALAGAYLGGSLNSSESIADFPLAIVDEDAGAVLPDGTTLDAGEQVASGILAGIDAERFDVQVLTLAEAEAQMDEGALYGAIVLPETFSADLLAWATGSVLPGEEIVRPQATVLTNTRAGTAAATIAGTAGTAALDAAAEQLGIQLTAMVAQQQEQAGLSTPLTATAAAALAAPLTITVEAHDPLPDGTGGGLSAFYYALLIVLAGFTGSVMANTLIDARLGFLPTEFGPLYRLERSSGISRRTTLLIKWGVGALIAVVVSALYVGISAALGMPIDDPWLLWGFGVATIFAVSMIVQAINALVGNAGMLINMIVFIVLGLPSAGGTLPVEATPRFFRWLSGFEPLHQIYLGTRSLLYYGGTWESGLGRSLLAAAIMAVLGLAIGLVGVTAYDRTRHVRGFAAPTSAPSAR
ncbi:YhgE/Pip domain-containing protein [Brachybacterium sp. DNPG3]